MSQIQLRTADLGNPDDCALLARLTDAYASDAMGGGAGLSEQARSHLAGALARHPGLFALIVEHEGQAVGHALCILGFSTFYAAPVCNIHDLAVLSQARGLGIGRRLMRAVEIAARDRGCAKVTLEVRQDNQVGRKLYDSEGFAVSGLGGTPYLLMEKKIG